jgi:hypothetical protein
MNNYDKPEFEISLFFFIFFFFVDILIISNIFNFNEEDNLNIGCDDKDIDIKSNDIQVHEETKQHVQLPYEEKYLIKLRNMKNEYIFTEEELKTEEKKLEELKKEENNKKLESIYILNDKIEELNIKLDEININSLDVNKNYNKDYSLTKKLYDSIENEIDLNKKQLFELQKDINNYEKLKEEARQFVINEQLKKFKNKCIIEHTPLGNVLMFYNHEKLAFEYYSDSTIPYRYLETVSRKYVLTYNYRPLYIDMEEELKEYEKKLEEKESKEKQINKIERDNSTKIKTKDVFAKFKSYNKEAGSGRVNTAPPPKNSIPQNRVNINLKDNNANEKILLKEKANRYSYQGKFLNFNILKKIDKKVVDKKYDMTFADFKKMNILKK